MRSLVAASLALVASCNGSSKKWALPPVTIDPAAVNALVPAELKSKLEFVKQEVVRESNYNRETYELSAPKSWKKQDTRMTVILKPPGADGYGSFTALEITSNCDGGCVAKDWKATSDKVEFSQYQQFKIVKDEAGASNRLVIASNEDRTYVTYAWWADGATRYYVCKATLQQGPGSPDPRAAADAFALACKAVHID